MNKEELEKIRDLQMVELIMFKHFINVCDQLNLNYYLIGGTLIGAVRHKGFIPWDDDIDVCMLRKDYDIFLKEAPRYLDKKYFLQTYETDEDYFQCFAKIRNNETAFIEKSVKTLNMNHGVFIDIFPLDNYYNYNFVKVRLLRRALYNKYFSKNESLKKRIKANVADFFYGKKTKKELCRKIEKIYKKANNRESLKVVNYNGAWGIKRETYMYEDFSDYKLVDFEKIKVKIPIGYDRVLSQTYGDYMKLPPSEKRISHHFSEIIDIRNSYKKYLNDQNK